MIYTFYRYISVEEYDAIDRGDIGDVRGMIPLRKSLLTGDFAKLNDLPDIAIQPHLTGLIEPLPVAWCRPVTNGVSCLEMEIDAIHTQRTDDIYLLRITLPTAAHLWVANHGAYYPPAIQGNSSGVSIGALHAAYWKTVVPIRDYVRGIAYMMPEIICPLSPSLVQDVIVEGRYDRAELLDLIHEVGNCPPPYVKDDPESPDLPTPSGDKIVRGHLRLV